MAVLLYRADYSCSEIGAYASVLKCRFDADTSISSCAEVNAYRLFRSEKRQCHMAHL